jgi:hypothetical protein
VVIALGACIVGLGMGLHASWSGIRVYALVGGIEVRLIPPVAALAGACGLLIGLTLVSVLPMVVGIARLRPRLLLGATRG